MPLQPVVWALPSSQTKGFGGLQGPSDHPKTFLSKDQHRKPYQNHHHRHPKCRKTAPLPPKKRGPPKHPKPVFGDLNKNTRPRQTSTQTAASCGHLLPSHVGRLFSSGPAESNGHTGAAAGRFPSRGDGWGMSWVLRQFIPTRPVPCRFDVSIQPRGGLGENGTCGARSACICRSCPGHWRVLCGR